MQRTLARFGVLAVCLIAIAPPVGAQNQPITIRAARVIDGKGKVLPNTVVEVQGSKITKIDTRGGASLAADLGSSRDEARASMPLAFIRYLRGDLREAERLGEQTRDWLERTGETFFQIQNLIALGQYALARQDAPSAEARFREALPIALEEDSFLVAEIYRLLTETLILLGRLEDAAELAEFAARGTGVDHPYTQAAFGMAEAAVATANGDLSGAATRYKEAIGLMDELGLSIEMSQAQIAYGRVLRDLGEFDAARMQFQEARQAFDRMGATGLLVDVEQELALIASATG